MPPTFIVVRTNKHLSKPWGEKEIRFFDNDVKKTLNRSLWKLLEQQIMQGHIRFLKSLRDQGEPAAAFLMSRLSFDHDLGCGIIEVQQEVDVGNFRDRLVPLLRLTTKLKALIKADHKVPIMTAFAPAIYQGYENNDYVDLLKLVNPILEQERFINIKAIHREQGTLYFFRTYERVVAYIKENNYVLKHAMGQAIFNRRIEFKADSDVC
jgi:hypothetical protein